MLAQHFDRDGPDGLKADGVGVQLNGKNHNGASL